MLIIDTFRVTHIFTRRYEFLRHDYAATFHTLY